MGHSQAEKAESHERIVRAAAERIRESGLDGLSIASLMKDAGLTHGGFYKHFRSRDDLVDQALALAFKNSESPTSYGVADVGDLTFEAFVGAYLSKIHRDNRGSGCAIGALVSDLGRGSDQTKALHTRQVQRHLEGLIRRMGKDCQPGDRSEAILAFTAMVGAIGLSRAVSDPDLSEEILVTVRRLLKERQKMQRAS